MVVIVSPRSRIASTSFQKSLRTMGSPPVRCRLRTPQRSKASSMVMSSSQVGSPCAACGADMKQWRQR